MKFNRKTAKKLASLSAVGAGALVLTAQKAEAGIVYSQYPGIPVGFGLFTLPYFSTTLSATSVHGKPFGFGFSAATQSHALPPIGSKHRWTYGAGVLKSNYNNGFWARPSFLVRQASTGSHPNRLNLFNAGALWAPLNTANSTPATNFLVASRFWGSSFKLAPPVVHTTGSGGTYTTRSSYSIVTHHSLPGNPAGSNQYALFTFNPTGILPLYGWVDLSISVQDVYGDPFSYGPKVTVNSWAYDNTGAQLPAGTGIPEPGTLSLAALALGAVGLRRWRSARKKQAA